MHLCGSRFKRMMGSALCALVLLCPMLLTGQSSSGEIRLAVKDPSGAAMQAAVHLAGSGGDRRFQTDAQGTYTFSNLSSGRYRLEVSKQGFTTQSMLIDVPSGTPVSRVVTLELAAQASRIDVVAATPLPGTNLPIDQIAAPVQTASARDLEQTGALDLSDLLNQRLSGVHVNQNQENPYQPDVNYRGYTASPLLGTPEGISVYMDGVRQNQPFGDIVAWSLIPKIAFSAAALLQRAKHSRYNLEPVAVVQFRCAAQSDQQSDALGKRLLPLYPRGHHQRRYQCKLFR